jgi:hypothetical protein
VPTRVSATRSSLQFKMRHPSIIPVRTSLGRATDGVRQEDDFVFAPNGDIILELGSQGQISCTVSSAVLERSSKVFRVMFGSNFKEGSQLAAARSKKQMYRLPLVEDNADAMLIMLACLHGAVPTFSDLGKTLRASVETMVQIAVVVEKYLVSRKPGSMIEGLRPSWKSMRTWYRTCNGSSIKQTLDFMFLAWAFRDRELFAETSRELIRNTDGSFLGDHEYLPESVIGMKIASIFLLGRLLTDRVRRKNHRHSTKSQ